MRADRLERIALAHLQRHASSAANLRRVLRRRIGRSCAHHGDDPESFAEPLEELLTKLVRVGLLDDRRYATSLVKRHRQRGASMRQIRARLFEKGIDSNLADDVLQDEAARDGDAEVEAAIRYARRRRLGPFRVDPDRREEHRERDLGALGRRGFGFGVAVGVVDADSPEDFEAAER